MDSADASKDIQHKGVESGPELQTPVTDEPEIHWRDQEASVTTSLVSCFFVGASSPPSSSRARFLPESATDAAFAPSVALGIVSLEPHIHQLIMKGSYLRLLLSITLLVSVLWSSVISVIAAPTTSATSTTTTSTTTSAVILEA